jgi:hypothetical protein
MCQSETHTALASLRGDSTFRAEKRGLLHGVAEFFSSPQHEESRLRANRHGTEDAPMRTPEVVMAASIVLLLPALAFSATVATAHTGECIPHDPNTRHEPALTEFMTTVNEYVELHRVLANPLSALILGADPEQTARARRAHRSLIREAREIAELPNVFTPCVSAYLRLQIRRATGKLQSNSEQSPLAAVLDVLPELPTELDYRFVARDLVLVDVEADLVVDTLENALPSSIDEESEQNPAELCAPQSPPIVDGSACDAHPELAMCWS